MLLTVMAAAVLLIGLLVAEQRQSLKGRLLFKPLLSLLFVITALLQAPFQSTFGAWILAGLGLSLAGDVFLAVPGQKSFLTGIAMFTVAHILYIFGFTAICPVADWSWWAAFGLAAAGSGIFAWLYPRLGALKLPVAVYVTVISLMLLGAVGIGWNIALPLPGRNMVLLGALMFYLSDLFVARNRFIENQFINRLIGLPLYYTGQFLLAYSIGIMTRVPA